MTTSSVGALDSMFTNLITQLMSIERQPLTQLTTKRDTITVQQAVYSDLSKMLSDFQNSVHALKSDEPDYSFTPARKVSISNVATGATVASATATAKATPASYQLSVTSLAKEHRVRSDRQTYSDQALDYAGTFVIGGSATRSSSITATIADTVQSASTGEIASGKTELGSGDYSVETRQDEAGTWQFRMVNSSGKAVEIRKSDSVYSSDWQSIPEGGGNVDTGRGMVVHFESDSGLYQAATMGNGAAKIAYTAKGASISVNASDSLTDIAASINKATYAVGNEVTATIIDNQLVLARTSAGAGNTIAAQDTTGSVLSQLGILQSGSFKNVLQTPTSAVFTINNIQVTRTQNTGLTDVVSGVTLNLAADSEGKTATINIANDSSSERSAVDTFVSKFNSLQTYLGGKIATIKQADGSYKRGALAGDGMFSSLRMDLFQTANTSVTNSGSFKRLADIGITLTDDMKLSVTDSSKFDSAVKDNWSDVTALMDAVMAKIDTKLDRFTGASGYVKQTTNSLDTMLKYTNDQITNMNDRLDKKQESLQQQYGVIQSQLYDMSATQQQMAAIYGSISSYT